MITNCVSKMVGINFLPNIRSSEDREGREFDDDGWIISRSQHEDTFSKRVRSHLIGSKEGFWTVKIPNVIYSTEGVIILIIIISQRGDRNTNKEYRRDEENKKYFETYVE